MEVQNPSIHPVSIPALSCPQARRGSVGACHRYQVTPDIAGSSQGHIGRLTAIHAHRTDNLPFPICLTCVFLDRVRMPENPRTHRENMQTPHRKIPRLESNPPHSCHETKLPTTAPLRCPGLVYTRLCPICCSFIDSADARTPPLVPAERWIADEQKHSVIHIKGHWKVKKPEAEGFISAHCISQSLEKKVKYHPAGAWAPSSEGQHVL